MIARIAVDAATFAIDKPFSYKIPADMILQPGMRVQVPFGRGNRRTEGIVLSVEEADGSDLKPVEQLLDAEPVLSPNMLRLAAFMHERYFCTLFDAVRAMLPAGLWFRTKESVSLTEDRSWNEKTIRVPYARAILDLLNDCGGQTDLIVLQNAVPDAETFSKAFSYLFRKKWIHTHVDYLQRTKDKTEKIATLCASVEETIAFANSRPKSSGMQRAVLELLCSIGSASVKEICYFTGAKLSTLKRLAELGFVNLTDRPELRCRTIKPAKISDPLVLNEDQDAACKGLTEQMHLNEPGTALLYGVTGSGKTAVYISLIQACLDQKKQAMLLVPEIALTPQLIGLMAAYFGEGVAVLHSSLAATERYDHWKRVRDGQARVVIGTRSAVFAPCAKLGLIIIDEEQEHSYKSENAPRYDAREIAMWRGAKERALVLLGSATPSIQTMYHAKCGHHRLYTLGHRYNGKALPEVEIIDMRLQLDLGNNGAVSYPLQDTIGQTSQQGKQTILFLNRRGNSRALVCVDCRESPECPRCNARLTFHSANQRLMCHYCGYSQRTTEKCPSCGGPLKRVGCGTQKVLEELQSIFPGMDMLRMDADTVNAANTHEQILDKFQSENIPVLVGTQMVAKGLNLPNVTLVGVLDADISLYADNYRAAETTFNMLTQVVGRAGRGDTPGTAMIQTMVPEHKVLKLAAKQDYDSFYDLEIGLRKLQKCPPFADLATITFVGQDEKTVLHGCAKFRDSLRNCLNLPSYYGEDCTVLGPAPCPVPKINYNFRYRLSLRCVMTKQLRMLLAHLLRQFIQDKDNRGVSAFVDVNGFD